MKKFIITFKEVSYGVVEVFAEDEDEARDIAECEGDRFVNKSYMELGEIESEIDVEDYTDEESRFVTDRGVKVTMNNWSEYSHLPENTDGWEKFEFEFAAARHVDPEVFRLDVGTEVEILLSQRKDLVKIRETERPSGGYYYYKAEITMIPYKGDTP